MPVWTPSLHPRSRDGRFIRKIGARSTLSRPGLHSNPAASPRQRTEMRLRGNTRRVTGGRPRGARILQPGTRNSRRR